MLLNCRPMHFFYKTKSIIQTTYKLTGYINKIFGFTSLFKINFLIRVSSVQFREQL